MIKVIRLSFWRICLLFFSASAMAQKGNNQIQVSAQGALPTGDLATLAKFGQGYSIKGLWGFSKAAQQATVEIGNNFFDIKNQYLVGNVEASYSTWPILAGYRRYFGNYFTEGQFGIAFNQIDAFRTDTVVASGYKNNRYAAGAIGIGYYFKNFELSARYQVALVKNDDDITFLAVRLAYRLPFYRKKEETRL